MEEGSRMGGIQKCCGPLKQRYIIACLTSCGVAVSYMIRICLSLAITVMVKKVEYNRTDSNYCPMPTEEEKNITNDGEFEWSDKVQGLILSGFYIGYIITQVPGGMLADKIGGKHVLGVAVLGSSIASILSPIGAKYSPYCLCFIRIIMGLFQGPLIPGFAAMASKWSPPSERTSLNMLMNSGITFGLLIGNALTGHLLHKFSKWDYVFYIYGLVGICWWLIWLLLSYSGPATHPYISEKEKTYIIEQLNQESKQEHGAIPWKEILTSVPFYCINIGGFGNDWAFYVISSDFPLYLSNVLHYKVFESGIAAALPWLAMWAGGMTSSLVSDIMIQKTNVSKLVIRRTSAGLANIVPAVVLMVASYAGCNKLLVAGLACLALLFLGCTYASLRVNSLDIGPNFAGTTMGLINGTGCLGGILAPIIIGFIVKEGGDVGDWRECFWLSFAILISTVLPFLFFSSASVQPWNDGKP